MKEQFEFVLFFLLHQILIIQDKIKKFFTRQDTRLVFVVLLVLLVIVFILGPSISGGAGGGTGG